VSLRRLLLPGAALAAATLLAAGCATARGDQTPVATNQVSMAKSYRFDPDVVRIKAGETVTWTNNDNFTHTVRVDGQPDHKVGRGDSVSIRFPNAGTYHYECTLHSHDMQGTVIVT
jgi:plastocyanin